MGFADYCYDEGVGGHGVLDELGAVLLRGVGDSFEESVEVVGAEVL